MLLICHKIPSHTQFMFNRLKYWLSFHGILQMFPHILNQEPLLHTQRKRGIQCLKPWDSRRGCFGLEVERCVWGRSGHVHLFVSVKTYFRLWRPTGDWLLSQLCCLLLSAQLKQHRPVQLWVFSSFPPSQNKNRLGSVVKCQCDGLETWSGGHPLLTEAAGPHLLKKWVDH